MTIKQGQQKYDDEKDRRIVIDGLTQRMTI